MRTGESSASPAQFTVESLAPHRTLGVDENDELIDHLAERKTGYGAAARLRGTMILEHLKTSGVQQVHKRGPDLLHRAHSRGPVHLDLRRRTLRRG